MTGKGGFVCKVPFADGLPGRRPAVQTSSGVADPLDGEVFLEGEADEVAGHDVLDCVEAGLVFRLKRDGERAQLAGVEFADAIAKAMRPLVSV